MFARSICGEGFPDFYAKQATKHGVCINRLLDIKVQPILAKAGICYEMESLGYSKDENDDYLIEDCQKRDFITYYLSKESINAFKALYKNEHEL